MVAHASILDNFEAQSSLSLSPLLERPRRGAFEMVKLVQQAIGVNGKPRRARRRKRRAVESIGGNKLFGWGSVERVEMVVLIASRFRKAILCGCRTKDSSARCSRGAVKRKRAVIGMYHLGAGGDGMAESNSRSPVRSKRPDPRG